MRQLRIPSIAATCDLPPPRLATCGNAEEELDVFDAVGGSAVFIIDDDAAMRDSLEAMLRARGMRAEAFASVAEFLGWYDGTAAGCLVIDLNMPGGSGIEGLRALAARGIDLPAILMTGRTDTAFDAQGRAAGATATILKPFQPAALVGLIVHALAQRTAATRH
jgi:FixJ family two-component response regulator